jgi:anti-sigma regulatory factor (Ser/Thr protein kinase)
MRRTLEGPPSLEPRVGFRVAACFSQRPFAIDLVASFLRHVPGADGDFEDTTLTAFSEAFNTLVRRAYEGRTDGMLDVEAIVGAKALTIRMSDDGGAVDFTRPSQPGIDDIPGARLGLFLLHATVDAVAYRAGTPNVLTLTKRLRVA